MLSPRTKRTGISKTIFILGAAVFLFLLFFHEPVGIFFSEATDKLTKSPLKDGTSSAAAGVSFLGGVFSSKTSLYKENQALREKVSLLEFAEIDRAHLAEENEKLKGLLGRVDERKNILAGVIGKPNRSPYDTLILDVGREGEIMPGEKIFLENGLMIGEIQDVYSNTSRATLYSSPGIKTEAFLGPNRTQITLLGRGSGNFETELPRGVSVAKGDAVYTGGIFKRNMGVVSEIFLDPREPFQKIIIMSPFNIFSLDQVLVFRDK